MSEKNTFGECEFEKWVPEHTQKIIKDFWGCFGRTYKDWLDSPNHQGVREFAHHGPGPNGFGMPPNGATAEFFIKNWELSKKHGIEVFEVVRGRYLHRWNNMGSLIDETGKDWTVSTCDRWLRVFTSSEEKEKILWVADERQQVALNGSH